MQEAQRFIAAYRQFRETVDFTRQGRLPCLENVIWCLVMGFPSVPADEDGTEGQLDAVAQRVAILKAVFVEVNQDQPEMFLDQGLALYDEAGREAGRLLGQTAGRGIAS